MRKKAAVRVPSGTRKDYLKYVRSRKHTAQKTREAIRKQLNYLRRDLEADKIYRNRDNLAYCKQRRIRL